MSAPPAQPKIYHISHVGNLPKIVADGCLFSDRAIRLRSGTVVVGMQGIKDRRLGLPVSCHPGDFVGDYVPFYFCPPSVMLFLLYMGNHPEITYKEGQDPIVHLECDLREVVDWADQSGRNWAFTISNAGAYYSEFRSSLHELAELNWTAIGARDWRDPDVKEGKQAEFLLHEQLPFDLVRRIGVKTEATRRLVESILAKSPYAPTVTLIPGWYY